MPWSFKPQQRSVVVVPGETALAFYTAYNPSDAPVTGVSTYNVSPPKAGLYFHKVRVWPSVGKEIVSDVPAPSRGNRHACLFLH